MPPAHIDPSVGTGGTVNETIVEYMGVFESANDINDIFIYETTLIIVGLFVLAFVKIFITKTQGI